MPKTQQQINWLNNHFNEKMANGEPLERSQVIADQYNNEFGTEAWARGPPPKHRIIMTNGGLDAQTVGGHMADRKKRLNNHPRATRHEKNVVKSFKAVSEIRPYPWVGDKMLLMETHEISHGKIKNLFEEKARQDGKLAKKAGGQELQDFEARKRARTTSNKYASKMWAGYRQNKTEYLQKLRNGLISLETGEAIKGDSSTDPCSALNPANRHMQSMSNDDGANKNAEGNIENGADLMAYAMENVPNFHNEYPSMAGPSQYHIYESELPRSKDQAEDSANKKGLGHTKGSIGNIDSQMSFHQNNTGNFDPQMSSHHNYFGGDGPGDIYFGRSPLLYNYQLGAPQPETILSVRTFNIQTPSQGGISIPAFNQQSANNFVHPEHSKSMYMGPQPSNQGHQPSNVGSDSLRESGWDFGQTEESTASWRDATISYEAQANRFEQIQSSSQMEFAMPNKRKEAPPEEGTVDVRHLMRQRQPEGQLEPEGQGEDEQFQPAQFQYNRLDFGEGDVDLDERDALIEAFWARTEDFEEVDVHGRHAQELNHIQELWDWNPVPDIAASPIQHHSLGNSNRGGQFDIQNNTVHPEGNLFMN